MLACAFLGLGLLAGCSDSPVQAPIISAQPTDAAAAAGTAATLSISASGADISYQWQLSTDAGGTWSNLAGATTASYTTPTLSTADSGKRYRAVITAAGVSVNSSAVTLTVTAAVVAPSITVAPAAQSAMAPTAAAFSVTATGTALAYQWQRSTDAGSTWQSIAGATSATYDTGATSTTMNNERYRVVVSNSTGSVTSAAATLSVVVAPAAPAITTQPSDQSAVVGASVAFSVVATGAPAPTLQWQRSTDLGVSWTNISAATDSIYNTGAVALSQDSERYRVVVSNSAGTVNSSAARLSVTQAPQAPVITTQPSSQTVTAPASATFITAASGVPTPTWQWQMSTDSGSTWANVNGATAASYTTPPTVTGDSGKRFRAVATNASGNATTQAVQLTVTVTTSGTWQSVTGLRAPDATLATIQSGRSVAADASGNFVALWSDLTYPANTNATLRSSRYTAGAGWSAAQVIDADTMAFAASVTLSDDGRAVAVFKKFTNGVSGLWASTQMPGSGWSAPVQVQNDAGNGNNFSPAVVTDGSGNVTAAWLYDNNVEKVQIRAARLPAGAGAVWSTPVVVAGASGDPGLVSTSSNGPLFQIYGGRNFRLVANANGDVVVGWSELRFDGTGGGSAYPAINVYRNGLGWIGTQTPLTFPDPGGGSSAIFGDVTLNNGVAVVLWTRSGTNVSQSVRWNLAAASWSDSQVIPSGTDEPRIALAPDGSVTAVWAQDAGASNGVVLLASQQAASGGAWGTPLAVDPVPSFINRLDIVRSDAAGNMLICWDRSPGNFLSEKAYARRLASGSWSAPATIAPADRVSSFIEGFAVSGNGDAVATWLRSAVSTTRFTQPGYQTATVFLH